MITKKEMILAARKSGTNDDDAFIQGAEWAFKAADVAWKVARINKLDNLVDELRRQLNESNRKIEIYEQKTKDLKYELEGYSSDERDYI